MIYSKWTTFPYLLAVLLLLVPPTEVQAQVLPLAESATVVNCSGTIVGTNIPLPGPMTSTCSELHAVSGGTSGEDAVASTSVSLSVTGPPANPQMTVGEAKVSGSNTGTVGGNMSAGAQLLFYFDLLSIAPPPPGPPGTNTVTIDIDYNGGGSATGISGQYYSEVRTTWGVAGGLSNELITFASIPDPPFSVTHSIDFIDDPATGTSPTDWSARIWLMASCSAGGGPGATCDAYADPIFSFADPSFADYYAFNFSPNMPIIPVPAAVWLFGSGLIGLICVARRKAD